MLKGPPQQSPFSNRLYRLHMRIPDARHVIAYTLGSRAKQRPIPAELHCPRWYATNRKVRRYILGHDRTGAYEAIGSYI